MTSITARTEPTVFLVWAPTCVECRAMQEDLEATAAEFAGVVELERVNVATAPESARELGARATPTLIAVGAGRESFRVTGRRTRTELGEIFRAAAAGTPAPAIGRHDRKLRVGAGIGLVVAGALTGPAWPLVAIGVGVGAWALVSRNGSRNA